MTTKLFFVARLCPVIVLFFDFRGVYAGRSFGPIIIVKSKYKNDTGLIIHELEHARQWYKLAGIFHSLLYLFSKKYRYKSELEAYKKQLEHTNKKGELALKFARFISTKYGLKVSEKDVFRDLIV